MESYSCWALVVNKYKMDTSRADTRRKKVQECKTATDFFFPLGGGKGGMGWFSDSCHPAPPTRCLQHLLWNHKPFASHGLGRLCPSMWTDTVCGVCIICLSALGLFVLSYRTREKPQWSRDWLSWLTNSSSALPISRRTFRYKDVALTVQPNQWSWYPLPHPVYIYGHPFLVLNIFPE